jgi:hypothetical protein
VTYPLKKQNEELTTADIAQQSRTDPAESELEIGRPRLVPSERDVLSDRRATEPDSNAAAMIHDEKQTIDQEARTIKESEIKPTRETQATALFPESELPSLRSNWDRIQTTFVDEPRSAVEQADSLVATTMKRLAEIFAQERSQLENQWSRGDNVSTEDLRLALQRYRSFFQRLLAI